MVFGTVTKSLRAVGIVLAVAWMSPANTSARSATIENVPPTPHHAPPGTPQADLAEAVKLGVHSQGWVVLGSSPGATTAQLTIRSHTAIVVIRYDESDYQIDYLDSVNLNFNPNDKRSPGKNGRLIKGPRIHRNYNLWVKDLGRSVAAQLRTPPQAAAPPAASSLNTIMIADELKKLDVLRQQGILTQQEFDKQKARLLR